MRFLILFLFVFGTGAAAQAPVDFAGQFAEVTGGWIFNCETGCAIFQPGELDTVWPEQHIGVSFVNFVQARYYGRPYFAPLPEPEIGSYAEPVLIYIQPDPQAAWAAYYQQQINRPGKP